MSGVIVNYNNNALTSMSSSGTKTLLTSGKYCEGNFEVVYSAPALSSLTVTPTETAQTFNATGVYGYKPVTVNAISSTYVGTNISRRDINDINWDLDNGYIGVPSGYYSDGVPLYINTVSHPKPTIGISSTTGVVTATHQMSVGRYIPTTYSSIVTSTYSLPTQAAQTFYPSTADQTISSYRWLTGTQTIKSVTTSNLTAENIAEGVVVKVGDANNASRITQLTGTHKGGGGHDAVLLNAGTYNERLPQYTYVNYNDTRYYTNEDTFNFNEGDTIQTIIYGTNSSNVYLNNTLIGSGMNVSFSAPSYPLTVYFSVNGIYFNKAYPSGTLSITSNGTYNVYGYSSASVNVAPTYTATITKGSPVGISVYYNNTLYSSTGSTFTYSPGDNLSVYIYKYNGVYKTTELLINGETVVKNTDGTTISYNYSLPATNINLSLNYGFSPYNQLHIAEQIIPSSTTTILSHGLHNVYGYSTISNPLGGEDGIYKQLIRENRIEASGNVSYNYTSEDVVNFIDSFNTISEEQFNGKNFYGSFNFTNVSNISYAGFCFADYGVGYIYEGGIANFTFPSVKLIDIAGFYNNLNISYINCPQCSQILGSAFRYCSFLNSISFPNCTYISAYAFYDCVRLTTAEFPNCSFISSSAFYNCNKLTTIDFPVCSTIKYSAFHNCKALTSANFPVCSSIEDYTFAGCTSLASVNFPVCTFISRNAFQGCSNLNNISFPMCSSIGSFAFNSCVALTTIDFPACTFIGSGAFQGCSNLNNISFPMCSSIGSSAFNNCVALTTIDFPVCTNIYSYAFNQCYNLISLYLNNVSSVPTLSGTGVFNSTPIGGYSTSAGQYGSVFVPASLYSSFLTATYWSKISSRIVSV